MGTCHGIGSDTGTCKGTGTYGGSCTGKVYRWYGFMYSTASFQNNYRD